MNDLLILEGDATEQLRTLDTGCVQCVVTSPPYDNLRTYGGHSWDFESVALELYRVLCDGGVLCWNVNDSVVDGSETLTSCKQKIFFREQCGFRIHDTMIWEKPTFSSPESSRYYNLFEYVFILSKGRPRTFNPIIDRPNIYAGKTRFGIGTKRQPSGEFIKMPTVTYSALGKRGNVWKGNTSGEENPCSPSNFEHPATMPKWLATDLIASWSNVEDTVADPFAGSGTTGIAARERARKAILIDINPEYCALIRQNLNNTQIGLPVPEVNQTPVESEFLTENQV